MKRPPTYDEAAGRGLLAKKGEDVHTFSNGTEGYGWMDNFCHRCRFFAPDAMGALCALEGAMQLHQVTPELAMLFGFTQAETKYGPRSGWRFGSQECGFFRDGKDDDGNEIPLPPPTDPNQLVLIADPTEDAAAFNRSPAPSAVEELRVEVPA